MEPRLLLCRGIALLTLAFFVAHAYATWKPEYAQLSPEVCDWHKNQELNPAAAGKAWSRLEIMLRTWRRGANPISR